MVLAHLQDSIFFQIVPDSGKRGMTEPSAERSAELFSKTSEMVPNGLNIPMYEFEDRCKCN